MTTYTITLSDAEDKALGVVAYSAKRLDSKRSQRTLPHCY
jgi:hypothetical protein